MAATREQVLQAYKDNPLAELNPGEEAINYWMGQGLGSFGDVVNQVRTANPALAAQIDAQRRAATVPAPAPQIAYFQQNPDVAAAYQQNTYGLSPEDFAKTHWERFGQFEQRVSPLGVPAPIAPTTPTAPTAPVLTDVTGETLTAGDLGGAAPAPAPAAAPTDPKEIIKYLNQTDPGFGQRALDQYRADVAAAQGAAEGSIQLPGMVGTDVSGWNITPIEGVRPHPLGDIPDRQVTEADKIVGGYQATKTTTGPEGKPVETTISYDPSGNITGSSVRVFTGGDSGIVFQVDANGNLIGQPQGFDYSEGWKNVALPIANMALMALTGPGSGLASGLTSALAPTLGQGIASQIAANAIIGAGRGAVLGGLTGQDVGASALRGGIAGGAGSALGALGETAGAEVSKFVGPYLPEGSVGDLLQSLSGNVAQGVVRDVGGSLVGSALTGRDFDVNTALASGALSGLTRTVFEEARGNPTLKALPPELQNTAFAALSAQLRGRDPGPAALNALIGSIVRGIGGQAKTTSTGGGGDFGSQSIWEGWDPSGGEGVSTTDADQVSVTGTRMPWEEDTTDLVGLFTTTTTQKPGQTVPVIGTRDSASTGDTFLDDLIKESVTLATTTTQRVTVTGKPITTTEAPGDTTTTSTTQKVTVTGKPITTTEAPGDTTTTSTTQRVTVTDKPITTTLPPVVTTTAAPTTTVRPTTTTTTTTARPVVGAAAIQQPTSQIQDMGTFKSVFYEKMQREEQQKELARQLQEQENADPYERLMALAEKNPNMAVDELMRIIEGA